ncbi:MAG: tRNA threonylcarbamoyladenosine biosynthesis protein TsaE [Cryomorphaceae bacterium]|jgi:tRNA threonylcarbamoyladenosine biosynthesis protein TsaE
MTGNLSWTANNLAQTHEIGGKIAETLRFPACVYLDAPMGAGKTTLCKSIIQRLGCSEAVTSPTYNLIQQYPVSQGMVFHMDLYRLNDPAELEYLAIEDLWSQRSIFLIEWPERGQGHLWPATHTITIRKKGAEPDDKREIVLHPSG